MTERPPLFVDVDGVLNTRRGDTRSRRPPGVRTFRRRMRHSPGRFITFWLDPAHGQMLRGLANTFDLVWATAWEETANQHVAARLGLPDLPFVDFGVGREWNDPLPPVAAKFRPTNAEAIGPKTPEVAAFAGGRDFVWVDDELGPDDVAFLQRVHAGRFWLYRIQEQVGLTQVDCAVIGGLQSDQSGVLIEQAHQLRPD